MLAKGVAGAREVAGVAVAAELVAAAEEGVGQGRGQEGVAAAGR